MSRFLKKTRQLAQGRHRLFQLPGLRYFAVYLDKPAYWAMNRRKIALGVAIGLFCGLIPGPPKRLSAIVLTLLARVNLPAALITSLYSNPITIFPLYILAYAYGQFLLTGAIGKAIPAPPDLNQLTWMQWVHEGTQWMLSLGKPLAVGVPALAISFALVGYGITLLVWRCAVVNAWRQRKNRPRC